MNSKGAIDDWRILFFYPILIIVDVVLKSPLAKWAFDKYRTKVTTTTRDWRGQEDIP